MREYRHAYCSGQSYSASSSVGVQSHLVCWLAYYAHVCMYAFTVCACPSPRVLHFNAFIHSFFTPQWQWTPLHDACNSGQDKVVTLLLSSGADPLIEDNVSYYSAWFYH